MAVPLCLPNNYKWNPETGKCTKIGEERSSLYVVDEALQKLSTIKGAISVIAIAGSYRNGKSYLLGEAFNQPDVFPVGHVMDPETTGIWLWIVPDKIKNSYGQDCTVVLLDTEGIDALCADNIHDNQIFTLTVLLSSVLIYNSTGVPTRNDLLGMDFITKLSQRVRIRSIKGEMAATGDQTDTESFHKTFPFFIWLLRDVTQSVPPDCRDIQEYFLTRVFRDRGYSSSDQSLKEAENILRFFCGFRAFTLPPPTSDDEVLQHINDRRSQLEPRFLSKLEQFKRLLRSLVAPKVSFNDGDIVTGESLAALTQLYVEAINRPGDIPNIQTTWEVFVKKKCSEAQLAALRAYEGIMTSQLSGQLPCDNDVIRQCHDAALEEGTRQLETDTIGLSSNTTEQYLKELTETANATLSSWTLENETLTKELCSQLLVKLKGHHLDSVIAQLQEGEVSKLSFDNIADGYKRMEKDFHDHAIGAKSVCAAAFSDYHPRLMSEMLQNLRLLQQLKVIDERKTRETALDAFRKQEKEILKVNICLQEEICELHKKIKMLSVKQYEARVSDFEQMKAEQISALRDQMTAFTETIRTQFGDERKAYTQERESLQECMFEMTKSVKRIDRNMENLQQQLIVIQARQQDVQNQAKCLPRLKKGPTEDELGRLAQQLSEEDWKTLGRALDLKEKDLKAIKVDHPRCVYERALAMLHKWTKKEGRTGASYEKLKETLNDIQRGELLEIFSCDRKTVAMTSPLKQGSPSEKEIASLSAELPEEWFALGVALRLEYKWLIAIQHNNQNDVHDQSYLMLQKWKRSQGSKATYSALAIALEAESVQRRDLAETFCCDESLGEEQHCLERQVKHVEDKPRKRGMSTVHDMMEEGAENDQQAQAFNETSNNAT